MSKFLIPNPPSHEAAQMAKRQSAASKPRKFQTTPAVREALENVFDDAERYTKMMTYLMGGKVTGSKLADGYALAGLLVEWESSLGFIALESALQKRSILLNDIVKRIPAELRKLGLAVEGWVCTGTLISDAKAEEPELKAVNG